MIANGKFEVTVVSNMKLKLVNKNILKFGDYFGEISILHNCQTTATVSSVTYSTCTKISRESIGKI